MTQTIRIEGIAAEGRHGASRGERHAGQPFVVDVDVEVDARDDDLGTTADYRPLIAAVRDVVETESYALIETLAQAISRRVAEMAGVRDCLVTVHKPRAADRLEVADVSARTAGPR